MTDSDNKKTEQVESENSEKQEVSPEKPKKKLFDRNKLAVPASTTVGVVAIGAKEFEGYW